MHKLNFVHKYTEIEKNVYFVQVKSEGAQEENIMTDNPNRAPCNIDTINKVPQDLAQSQPIHDCKTLELLSGGSHLLDTSSIGVKQCRQNTASVSSPSDDDAFSLLQPHLPCNNKAKDVEDVTRRIDTQIDVICKEYTSDVILDKTTVKPGKYRHLRSHVVYQPVSIHVMSCTMSKKRTIQ